VALVDRSIGAPLPHWSPLERLQLRELDAKWKRRASRETVFRASLFCLFQRANWTANWLNPIEWRPINSFLPIRPKAPPVCQSLSPAFSFVEEKAK